MRNQQTTIGTKLKRKMKFPYLILGEDNHTKNFLHHIEVTKFSKGISPPAQQ